MCNIQYNKSLVNRLVNQKDLLELDEESIKEANKNMKTDKEKRNAQKLERPRQQTSNDQKKLVEVIREVGASSWVNAIPLKRYSFHHILAVWIPAAAITAEVRLLPRYMI